jgi:aspartyl/glutamyl-tRNA(Asn/Gln) amidotransferase C subunit
MLSVQDMDKLLALSRMEIADGEKDALRKDIDSILAYVAQIQGAAVGTLSEKHPVRNVTRPDGPAHLPGEYTEALIDAAPLSEDNQVKVKKIL